MKNNEINMAEAIRKRIAQLHEIAPDSIGDRMEYQLSDWDEAQNEVTLLCKTFDWMRNGSGTLHGGMCATVVDQAMGFVAFCIKPGEGIAPTIQMQTIYHRPLTPGKNVLVRVRVISVTRRLMNLSAEAYQQDCPEKICLTASGTYYYKPAGE